MPKLIEATYDNKEKPGLNGEWITLEFDSGGFQIGDLIEAVGSSIMLHVYSEGSHCICKIVTSIPHLMWLPYTNLYEGSDYRKIASTPIPFGVVRKSPKIIGKI